jgi:protein-S-isoprenylcysteine O-methyltransferase Ste14
MPKAKLLDLAAASPLIVLYAFAVPGLCLKLAAEIGEAPLSVHTALSAFSKAVGAAFISLQLVLFLRRNTPVAKLQNLWARAVAIVAANIYVVFLNLPPAEETVLSGAISSVIVIAGMVLSIWSLATLGRSFAILPQARGLVTGGPYRLIRHPLYLSEQIAGVGILLQYKMPWSVVVFAAGLALMIGRIGYEEDILRKTFPEYERYARRVRWLLIPRLY